MRGRIDNPLRHTQRWSRLSWGLDFTYREASFSNRRSEFDQLNVLSLNYAGDKLRGFFDVRESFL